MNESQLHFNPSNQVREKLIHLIESKRHLTPQDLCLVISNLPYFTFDLALGIDLDDLDINTRTGLLLLRENYLYTGYWLFHDLCNELEISDPIDITKLAGAKPLAEHILNKLKLIQDLYPYNNCLQSAGNPYLILVIIEIEDMICSMVKLINTERSHIISNRDSYIEKQKILKHFKNGGYIYNHNYENFFITELHNMVLELPSEELKIKITNFFANKQSKINRAIYENKNIQRVGIKNGEIKSLKSLKSGRKKKKRKY